MNPSVARSAGMLGEASSVVVVDLAVVSGKCTLRFARSAALTPQFLSYHEVTDRSTVATASGQCVASFNPGRH